MLINLTIKNIVLIDSLDLPFDRHFTALTGETGAGKSILLDALSLALGGKNDIHLIRKGEENAFVIAHFTVEEFEKDKEHPIFSLMKENDIAFDDSAGILLKRTLSTSQKGRCFVNDQPVSMALLKQFGDILLHVHGQHDNLLNESFHKQFIDNFAKKTVPQFEETLKKCKQIYQKWAEAQKELISFNERIENARAQREYYLHVRKELEPLKLVRGREDELIEKRQSLQQLGKIISFVDEAVTYLDGPVSSASIISNLYGLQKNLEKCDRKAFPALENAILGLEKAGIELSDVLLELKSLYETNRTASKDLEEIDEELHKLRGYARKYQTTCDGLNDLLETALQATDEGLDIEGQRLLLEKAVKGALEDYTQIEDVMFQMRKQAGEELSTQVMKELPDLKLENALFKVHIQKAFLKSSMIQANSTSQELSLEAQSPLSLKPSGDGGHLVAFWVAMNQGQTLAPLAKSASGGEMARLMLVLKMIIAKTTSLPTLIFDEIDTGVGGAVASAIGQKLRTLSEFVQVLSITHSPQVAASAHQQWKIFKTIQDGATFTHVSILTQEDRLSEIARMLSGASLTEEAKLAAKALLQV